MGTERQLLADGLEPAGAHQRGATRSTCVNRRDVDRVTDTA